MQCVNNAKFYFNFHINNLKLLKNKIRWIFCVGARCSLWVTFFICYQTLIQLMLNVNNWKVFKKWLNNITILARNLGLRYFPCHFFSIIIKFNMEKKSNVNEQGGHCFYHGNYAQITNKRFHLLFVHHDNKSNWTSSYNGRQWKNPRFLFVYLPITYLLIYLLPIYLFLIISFNGIKH